MNACEMCSQPFQGEPWMRRCEDCFREGRKSLPSKESKHYALQAERNQTPYEFIRSDEEFVKNLLAEAKAGIVIEVESDKPAPVSVVDCQHMFYVERCVKCGIFEHQFWYSQTVEPCALIGMRQ